MYMSTRLLFVDGTDNSTLRCFKLEILVTVKEKQYVEEQHVSSKTFCKNARAYTFEFLLM